MKMKSESEVAQSCLTLSDPMDHSLPGSSVHGIFQARVLEWDTIAFSDNPVDVGNLISCCSVFSKSRLNIWKFMVPILLKPILENFEHYFADL